MFVACFGKMPRLLLFFFLSDPPRLGISSLGDDGVEGRLPSDTSDTREAFGVTVFSAMVK